jgi:hypothetical protein
MILVIEEGSIRLVFVNSLWKMIWTCYKADYRMTEGNTQPEGV